MIEEHVVIQYVIGLHLLTQTQIAYYDFAIH